MKKIIMLVALFSVQSVFAVGHAKATPPKVIKAEKYTPEDCPLRKAKKMTLWTNTNPVQVKVAKAAPAEAQLSATTKKVK